MVAVLIEHSSTKPIERLCRVSEVPTCKSSSGDVHSHQGYCSVFQPMLRHLASVPRVLEQVSEMVGYT
jgi:hypothetical protein